ncbi:MAG: phosphoglucosamine mutase [bacterium]
MALKISISGVRGLVPETLTPEVCLNFAKAFGTYLKGGKVVVGIDPRASSEFIKGIVFQGLLSSGCRVIDLGICPTPTVGIVVRELEADGGIIITASHNPLPWNGLKFVREDGIFLNEDQANQLIGIYYEKTFVAAKPKTLSANSRGAEIHLKKILKIVNSRAIKRRKFKVAVDACNGAGSEYSLKLLKKLGCQVEAINCDLTLPFPHNPEPIAENLADLCAAVKKSGADIGFAFDADADRLAIVDETGRAIGEECTLALAVKFILSQNHSQNPKNKIIITNLSTTQAIEDVAKPSHAQVIRTKIGEVHVAEELKKLKGLIGGEGNGGVIYPKVGFNRDSLAGLALILNYLAAGKQTISELVGQLPQYHMIKKKFICEGRDEVDDFIAKTKVLFKGKNMILTEGIKVLLPDGWIHVRASNTEPVIRVIAEGKNKEEIEALVDQVLDPLN